MGNSLAPPPVDFRIERVNKKFQIPPPRIEALWKIFCKYDREGSGYISMDDFFERIIKYPRSGLTDQMFRLIESKSDAALTFGEFTEIVCTFACFEKTELLRYFFYILDQHRSGLVEKTELKHFIIGLWNNEVSSNLKEALAWLEHTDDGEGAFNFKQILALQLKYPNVFYPLYKLQVNIIQHSLGELFWENHKAYLKEEQDLIKQKELAILRAREKEEAEANAIVSDEMIRKRMGVFKYYACPWRREKEKNRILKIAAIEDDLNAQFDNLGR